jgi:hypothetical protein
LWLGAGGEDQLVVSRSRLQLPPGFLPLPQNPRLRPGKTSFPTPNDSWPEKIYVGQPVKTEKRAIIDDSYSYALTVICKDLAAHDAYQIDPIHDEFRDKCHTFWTRVQIYDAE